jgi:hypothetical protein
LPACNYVLSNAAGQIIWCGKNIAEKDLSVFENGIYFLRIISSASVETVKLLKQ